MQNVSDSSVHSGSSASPVQDFLKNPPPKVTPVTKKATLPDSPPNSTPQPTSSETNSAFTEDDRNRIGTKLTEAIAQAVKSGNLTSEEQLGEIIDDILILVNKIQTQEDLAMVFEALSNKWPFLSSVISEEQDQQNAVQHVKHMFNKQRNTNSANVS